MMETITAFFLLSVGLLVRLAPPVAITAVLVYVLRKLDARWQADAPYAPVVIEKPECWKLKGCPPEQRKNCPALSSSLPCWQVFRLPNGYLHEDCISCKVFIDAPVPALQSEPRRM
jgi:hypothetical protein